MTPAPKWYMPVAVVALLWNLVGVYAYLTNVMMSDEAIAALPAAEQAMHNDFPTWAVAGSAIAVWFGALGCVALIMKKGWAVPVLALSLVGVVVQDIGILTMAGDNSAGYPFQGVVLVISIALVMLARKAQAQGWIA